MITHYKQQKGLFTFFKEQQDIQLLSAIKKPKYITKHKKVKSKTKISKRTNKQSHSIPIKDQKQSVVNNLKEKFLKFILKNYQTRQNTNSESKTQHYEEVTLQSVKRLQANTLKIVKRTQPNKRISNSSLAKLQSMQAQKQVKSKSQRSKQMDEILSYVGLEENIIFAHEKPTKLIYLASKNEEQNKQKRQKNKEIKQKIKNRIRTQIVSSQKNQLKLPQINIGKIKKIYTQPTKTCNNKTDEIFLLAYPNNYFKNHVTSVRSLSPKKNRQVSSNLQSNLFKKRKLKKDLQMQNKIDTTDIDEKLRSMNFLANVELGNHQISHVRVMGKNQQQKLLMKKLGLKF